VNWLQLSYQYAVGGVFFFLTLYLCFRPGASDLRNFSDRRALIALLAGLVGYLAFHTAWIVLASQ